MRKIIQITMCSHDGRTRLVALCDDGTLWEISAPGVGPLGGTNPYRSSWAQVPPIPQE